MKKYISAILIPCFLMQLFGCYSQKEITYKEFFSMQNVKNPIVLTNKNKAFKLTADSVKNNYVMWEVTQDTLIILSETSIRKDHNNRNVVLDTLKIPSSEIKSVYIDAYNGGNAGIAISLAFVVVGGLLILVNNSGPFRNDNK